MHLYRINNEVYPDTNFEFTLTVTNLHLAPINHDHEIDDITGLADVLEIKSDIDHTHTLVRSLYVNDACDEEQSIFFFIETTDNSVTPATITVDGNIITFEYISPIRGIVDGAVNCNPQCDSDSIKFFTGSIDTIAVEKNIGMILFEEKENA